MRTLAAGVTTAFAAREVLLATMVRLDFPSGTIGLNSSNYSLLWSGVTYQAAAGLGKVSAVQDKPGDLPGVQLELLNVNPVYISLALDDADVVQGSLVTLSTAVFDSTSHQVIDVVLDWVGYADTMSIMEGGGSASIVLSAESKGVDLLRGNPLTYSNGDQQSIYPGDRAFEYVVSQTDKPVVWPTRQWFGR